MAVDHLLQEDGFRIEIEGVTDHLVLESSTTLDDAIDAVKRYFVQITHNMARSSRRRRR